MKKTITTENGKNVITDTIRREEHLQWLGGIFCGEGCISTYIGDHKGSDEKIRKSVYLQAHIVNTDFILMDKVEEILKENELKPIVYTTTSGRHRPLRVVKIVGNNKLKRFLTLILPYIIGTKSEIAKIMLRMIEYRQSLPHYNTGKNRGKPIANDAILINFVNKIKALNHGVPLNDYTPNSSKEDDDIVSPT